MKTSFSYLQACTPFVFDEIWCTQSGMALECGGLPLNHFYKGALRAQISHHHSLVLDHFGVFTFRN